MSGLAALVAGRRPAGIYQWHAAFDPEDVERAVEHAGGRFAWLDGWTHQTREEFLTGIGEALDFPDYYGHNFDALLDCLRDVATYPGDGDGQDDADAEEERAGLVLLWDGWSTLARADERGFSIAMSVLWQRVEEPEAGRFSVLLRGEGPEVDAVSLD